MAKWQHMQRPGAAYKIRRVYANTAFLNYANLRRGTFAVIHHADTAAKKLEATPGISGKIYMDSSLADLAALICTSNHPLLQLYR